MCIRDRLQTDRPGAGRFDCRRGGPIACWLALWRPQEGGQVNTHLECPSCRQSDRVVNVQAAYDNEASRISEDDYVLTMTHIGVAPTMMSRESAVPALARKRNPREEKPDTSYGCAMWMLIGILVLLLAGLLRLPGFPSAPTSLQIIADCIGVLIVVGVFLYMGRPVFRERTVVLPWWKSYMALWGKLYYCERCDVVFDPGQLDEVVPVSEMHDYLISRVGKRP